VRRVLLVDDHPVIRQGIRRILTNALTDLDVAEADTANRPSRCVRQVSGTSSFSICRCPA